MFVVYIIPIIVTCARELSAIPVFFHLVHQQISLSSRPRTPRTRTPLILLALLAFCPCPVFSPSYTRGRTQAQVRVITKIYIYYYYNVVIPFFPFVLKGFSRPNTMGQTKDKWTHCKKHQLKTNDDNVNAEAIQQRQNKGTQNMNKPQIKELIETHEARELYIYALNTSEPYHKFVEPTINALKRHAKRGDYSTEKAMIAWKKVADKMAHFYAKEYANEIEWNAIFSVSDRLKVAEMLEESEKENVFYELNNEKKEA